jgi:hypothetical protein
VTKKEEKQPSPEVEAKVHAAMEACKGNFGEAAKLLEMTRKDVKSVCWCSPTLRKRWWGGISAQPLDDIEGIDRQTISPEEQRIAWSVDAENAKFQGNLIRSGILTPAQVETAKALQILSNSHMSDLMDVTNASLTVLSLLLLTEVKTIEGRLAGVRKMIGEMDGSISEERLAAVEEEKSLSIELNQTIDTMRKIKAVTDQGAMNLAIIKYRLRNGANEKKAKPGFSPIDVQPSNS